MKSPELEDHSCRVYVAFSARSEDDLVINNPAQTSTKCVDLWNGCFERDYTLRRSCIPLTQMHERNLTYAIQGKTSSIQELPWFAVSALQHSAHTVCINVVCHKPHMPHHTTVCTDIMKLMKHDDSTWLDVCSTVAWRICYGIPLGRIRFASTANPRGTLFSVSDSDNKDLDHLVQRKLRECDIQAWVPAWQSHLWWQSLSRCVCYRCCPPSARHRWLPLELAVKPLNSWNAWTNMLLNLPSVVKLAFPQSAHWIFSMMAH